MSFSTGRGRGILAKMYSSSSSSTQRSPGRLKSISDENNNNSNNKDGTSMVTMETAGAVVDRCSCNRPIKSVLCQACGHCFKGRLRLVCLEHPNLIHLMDLECCPNADCQANNNLKEFN
ncbi:uncharacterized protein LOC141906028 [Tubulanus polymorphus]|uniref:uncharacterized protein LOC141906028 n=1 Tax=Tubulanus polymorphus TaxID=672921 RepID=UPI003DA3F9AD